MASRPPKAKGTSRASKARKSATKSAPKAGAAGKPASELIDQRIRDLEGWRGQTLARMRALILEADPEMIEEWKWSNEGRSTCTKGRRSTRARSGRS